MMQVPEVLVLFSGIWSSRVIHQKIQHIFNEFCGVMMESVVNFILGMYA